MFSLPKVDSQRKVPNTQDAVEGLNRCGQRESVAGETPKWLGQFASQSWPGKLSQK
jgi:hypothetical protein